MALAASALAAAVSGVFAVRLLWRFAAGSAAGTALLHWAIALALFCVASTSLLVGELVGWGPATFRTFYLGGAVLNVPWLALGSVHVSADSRGVSRVLGVVALGTGALFLPAALGGETLAVPGAALGAAWGTLLLTTAGDRLRVASLVLVVAFAATATAVVLGAGLQAPIPLGELPEGRDLLAPEVRGFAVGGNAIGALLVIVGAAASSVALAWGSADAATRAGFRHGLRRAPIEALAVLTLAAARATRARGLGHLALGNLLIALGVLIAASGGAFSFLGATVGHAVALAVGVTVMFGGFVRTGRRYGPGQPHVRRDMARGSRRGRRSDVVVEVYTREPCGLCRAAEQAVAAEARGARIELIDIDASDELVRRYGLRVPVVVVDGQEVAEGHVEPGSVRRAVRHARGGSLPWSRR